MKKRVILLLLLIFGVGVLCRSNKVNAVSHIKNDAVIKQAKLNIGWGDCKKVIVPLQVAYAVLDEVDVEVNQSISAQSGRLNNVETLVLTVPLNQIAIPQKVRVVSLRTGASVTFILKLRGNNRYGRATVQSDGKVTTKPRRMRLNVGRKEERKGGGKIEVCYVPPPAGSYWITTKELKIFPVKRIH